MKLSEAIRDGLQISSAQRCRTYLNCGFLVSLTGAHLHYLISVFAECITSFFLLSLSPAVLHVFIFPKSLISLISLFHLTPKPLDIPLSWMFHRAALTVMFWATSDPCTGSLSQAEPAPPPAAIQGLICFFQFRKHF